MNNKKITKRQVSEYIKQQNLLNKKRLEYEQKTLEELEEMLPILGGGYKRVCEYVINLKKLDGTA